tara:strand:- start:4965 stop:5234 length:270 start_codon:yes stop_codon:yes gene_type:complete
MIDYPERVTLCGGFHTTMTVEQANAWHLFCADQEEWQVIRELEVRRATAIANDDVEKAVSHDCDIRANEQLMFAKAKAWREGLDDEVRD